jgi:hypothetical protein
MNDELQAQVAALEAVNDFPSRQALWLALAQTPWAKGRGLTARALESRARRQGVTVRTPKAAGNRFGRGAAGPAGEHPDRPQAARRSSAGPAECGAALSTAPQRLSLPLLRRVAPARFRRLVGRVEAGSLRAAINLKCLDCSDYQVAEVRHCTVTGCPLFSVRPYQP